MSTRSILVTLTIFLLLCATKPSKAWTQQGVLEADLPEKLDATHLQAGSTFNLKLLAPWTHNACRLQPGTLLPATISRLTRDDRGHTEGFDFRVVAHCSDTDVISLEMVSLIASPVTIDYEPLPSFSAGMKMAGGPPQAPSQAFVNAAIASSENLHYNPRNVHVRKLPKTVTAGEVWRLPHIHLALSSESANLATLSTGKGPLRLPVFTIFVLREADSPAPADMPILAANLTDEVKLTNHAFLSACRQSSCSIHPEIFTAPISQLPRLARDEDLIAVGLKAERKEEQDELGEAGSVHFLGNEQVLVTFPTHTLVRRSDVRHSNSNPQPVRGVLIDVRNGEVKQIEDWLVPHQDAYVWPIGQDLLVYDQQALRVYHNGLNELARLALPTPLAGLRVSPDQKQILIGEVQEGPSAAHQTASSRLGTLTDESVQWSLFDDHLNRKLDLGIISSRTPVPVLLDDGFLELRRGKEAEWFLMRRNWDSATDTIVGSIHSDCPPLIERASPQLLSVSTCDHLNFSGTTYLVHEDGTPVAVQNATLQDLPLSFSSASEAPRLAFLHTQAGAGYVRGIRFEPSSLQRQALKVLDTKNGALLFDLPMHDLSVYKHGFALSPSGRKLAVLEGHTLVVYQLGDEMESLP